MDKVINTISLYLKLIRFGKPVGTILLLWPCLWGLRLGFDRSLVPASLLFYYVLLLTLGAFFMRSLGCIINDYVDRGIDGKVDRTKNRPLAAGALTSQQALLLGAFLLLGGAIIFFLIPGTAKLGALCGAFFMIIYPFMKRYIYHPQVVLGFAFNSGVFVGYGCLSQDFDLPAFWLFIAGICWTVAYDTIYAFQDIADDIKVGVKSTAVRYQFAPKLMVGLWYTVGVVAFIFCRGFFSPSVAVYAMSSVAILWIWDPNDKHSCDRCFRFHTLASVFGVI